MKTTIRFERNANACFIFQNDTLVAYLCISIFEDKVYQTDIIKGETIVLNCNSLDYCINHLINYYKGCFAKLKGHQLTVYLDGKLV